MTSFRGLEILSIKQQMLIQDVQSGFHHYYLQSLTKQGVPNAALHLFPSVGPLHRELFFFPYLFQQFSDLQQDHFLAFKVEAE